MPGVSEQTELDFMNWLFKQTTFPVPTTKLLFSFHSSDPGDTGANELDGGTSLGYDRAELDPDVNSGSNVNYSAITVNGSTQQIVNVGEIVWPVALGTWNGGNPIPYFGAWDATGTGFLFSGTINGGPGLTVFAGQIPMCHAGDFVASID